MITKVSQIAILVRDYEEAIRFYCGVLGFTLKEDQVLPNKRWVRIGISGNENSTDFILSKTTDKEQERFIGNQAGGRVFLYLQTQNLDSEVERLQTLGVKFTENPRNEKYGKIAVFEDLYGNRIDLIEPIF